MKVKLWLVLAALFTANAQAQLFKITNRTGTNAISEAAFNELEAQINKDLPNVDGASFAKAMGDAGVMASVGIGADYASDFDTIVLGGNFGVAVDVGNGSLSEISADNAGGIGVAGSILVGTRLDRWTKKEKLWFLETDRTKVFLNFFFFDPPDVADEIKIENKSFGARFQYKWLEPKAAAYGIFKWSGVDITTGFQKSNFDLTITQNIKEEITEQGITADFDGTATIGAEVSTFYIPIEISTGGRLFYLINSYVGLGTDLSLGSTKSVANVTGDITTTGAGSAVGSLDLGEENGPGFFNPRAFLGFQLDIPVVKFYVQANAGIDVYGLNTGLRLVW